MRFFVVNMTTVLELRLYEDVSSPICFLFWFEGFFMLSFIHMMHFSVEVFVWLLFAINVENML